VPLCKHGNHDSWGLLGVLNTRTQLDITTTLKPDHMLPSVDSIRECMKSRSLCAIAPKSWYRNSHCDTITSSPHSLTGSPCGNSILTDVIFYLQSLDKHYRTCLAFRMHATRSDQSHRARGASHRKAQPS
jgi:hypothetical protein